MGNLLSSQSWSTPPDTQPVFISEGATKRGSFVGAGSSPALFLDELEPTQASWSQESKCITIQRFFGWQPDSQAEKLKQDQKASYYNPRVVIHDISKSTSRGQAIVVVQRVYRRYRLLRKWHLVSQLMLEIAQNQLQDRAVAGEEEEALANFRQILASGFSAQKVSITGALKNIQLQLVLNPAQEECYLTWTPSRKRQPRIHLHDIQEVVPVLKEGNKHVPRLANKVSYRRGLIIVCRSHHRGRVVLQMGSKQERKVLLLGFKRLLEDLNRFAPTLDDTGAIRKQLPRRQSAVLFFEKERHQDENDKGSCDQFVSDEEFLSKSTRGDGAASTPSATASPSKISKRHSTSIEHFYHTRFDDPPTSAPVAAQAAIMAANITRLSLENGDVIHRE